MVNQDYKYEKKETDKLEIELKIEISKERFGKEKEKVFNKLSKGVEISGFRKGMVPRNIVEAKLGPKLFEETINSILPEVTVEILTKENLIPITRVDYKVAKVSDEGLEYTASFSLYPDVKLGDFKKIKIKEENAEITDKEVDQVMNQMFEDHKKREESKEKPLDSTDTRAVSAKKTKDKEKKKVIEMDDNWAKSTNLGVSTLKDLKDKTKEQLIEYKKRTVEEKRVTNIILEAVKISKIDVPNALIEQELERREADYKSRIEKLGLKLEDYLRSQNVTMEDLKKQWKPDALSKIQIELLLVEVARQNELLVEDNELESEINKIQEEELKDFYSSERGQNYVRNVMLQQKALAYLLHEIDHHNNPEHKH